MHDHKALLLAPLTRFFVQVKKINLLFLDEFQKKTRQNVESKQVFQGLETSPLSK